MCKCVKIYSVNTVIDYVNMFEQFLIFKKPAIFEKSNNNIVQNCIE